MKGDVRWALRLWRRGPARPRAGFAVLCAAASVAVLLLALGPAVHRAVASNLLEAGALAQVDLVAPVAGGAALLTEGNLEEVRRLEHVVEVQPEYTAGIYTAAGTDVPAFSVTARSWREGLGVPIAHGEIGSELDRGQIVLPERVGDVDLRPMLGETLSLAYTERTGEAEGRPAEVELEVVALTPSDWRYDGPEAAYASSEQVAEWAAARAGEPVETYRATKGARRATVVVDGNENVAGVVERLQDDGFDAVALGDRLRQVPTLVSAVGALARAVAVAAAALSVGVSWSVARAAGEQRRRELAIMRTLGVSVAGLRRQLLIEAGLTGAAVAAVSLALGFGGAAALTGVVAGLLDHEVPLSALAGSWPAVAFALIVPPLGAAVGAHLGASRALRQDPYVVAYQDG